LRITTRVLAVTDEENGFTISMTFTAATVRCPPAPSHLDGRGSGGRTVLQGMGVRSRRRVLSVAITAALGLLVATGATACEPARKEARNLPVLLIHGWGLGADTDCQSTFGRMISQMKSEGFTGPFVKVGFYSDNKNCDVNMRDWGPVENGSSFKVVAQAFSKYVYETYTKKGKAVDVVGYSMGGNVARGAVQGAQRHESGFAAGAIDVQDVVSFGAPFDGAAWYSSFCLWGMCSSLKPGATDIKWLNQTGNPQGLHGTEFSAFGSTDDAVTPVDSALHIEVPAPQKYRLTGVPHTGSDNYMGRTDVVKKADDALAKPGQ
jgi:hypothetical protein